ncbi:abortive infection family protein [Derxia gummosa]|uniref:Abortive infection family protein n=1 Tax=Derxia gummosa DSM 723 TaxID=1121388 RepID=A0A8B6XB52_9BURK|nr:abortive infection family protein [Derxia gummosa]
MREVLHDLLDPRLWTELQKHDHLEWTVQKCATEVNELLKYDGYEVVLDGHFYKVRELAGTIIDVENRFQTASELTELIIEEQIKKCREKIECNDYSGAITNARTLLESVCIKIESELDSSYTPSSDGDLAKLFNRARKLLNLDPSRQDISDALKQVLSGLMNIVNGLATMRNKMSDSHGVTYKPNRHHAKLAVNSAKTLADFLFDSMNYQLEKGSLKKEKPSTRSS